MYTAGVWSNPDNNPASIHMRSSRPPAQQPPLFFLSLEDASAKQKEEQVRLEAEQVRLEAEATVQERLRLGAAEQDRIRLEAVLVFAPSHLALLAEQERLRLEVVAEQERLRREPAAAQERRPSVAVQRNHVARDRDQVPLQLVGMLAEIVRLFIVERGGTFRADRAFADIVRAATPSALSAAFDAFLKSGLQDTLREQLTDPAKKCRLCDLVRAAQAQPPQENTQAAHRSPTADEQPMFPDGWPAAGYSQQTTRTSADHSSGSNGPGNLDDDGKLTELFKYLQDINMVPVSGSISVSVEEGLLRSIAADVASIGDSVTDAGDPARKLDFMSLVLSSEQHMTVHSTATNRFVAESRDRRLIIAIFSSSSSSFSSYSSYSSFIFFFFFSFMYAGGCCPYPSRLTMSSSLLFLQFTDSTITTDSTTTATTTGGCNHPVGRLCWRSQDGGECSQPCCSAHS